MTLFQILNSQFKNDNGDWCKAFIKTTLINELTVSEPKRVCFSFIMGYCQQWQSKMLSLFTETIYSNEFQ